MADDQKDLDEEMLSDIADRLSGPEWDARVERKRQEILAMTPEQRAAFDAHRARKH
jgi:hypothetical protein